MDKVSARAMNTAFVNKILQGRDKEAKYSIDSFIREKLREESFVADKILTEQHITDQDLDKDVDLDKIQKIVEKEPDSRANFVSFRGLPRGNYLTQDAFAVPFATIVTDEIIKNIHELKTRDNDVRKIISDNHVKDIMEEQDGKFIELSEQIITDFPDQTEVFAGGFTKINYAEALKKLPSKRIPNGCVLMNEATSKEVLKWDASEIGYNAVEEIYRKGLTVTELLGTKLIVTIKNEIVKDNEVWFFGQEDFLGKFYTLEDSTVHMESDGLFIKFYAYKTLGMGIINTKAVFKGVFTP